MKKMQKQTLVSCFPAVAEALPWCVTVEITEPTSSTKADGEFLFTARSMDHNSSPMCLGALLHEGSNKISITVNSLLTVKKAKLSILSFKYGAVDCNYQCTYIYIHTDCLKAHTYDHLETVLVHQTLKCECYQKVKINFSNFFFF